MEELIKRYNYIYSCYSQNYKLVFNNYLLYLIKKYDGFFHSREIIQKYFEYMDNHIISDLSDFVNNFESSVNIELRLSYGDEQLFEEKYNSYKPLVDEYVMNLNCSSDAKYKLLTSCYMILRDQMRLYVSRYVYSDGKLYKDMHLDDFIYEKVIPYMKSKISRTNYKKVSEQNVDNCCFNSLSKDESNLTIEAIDYYYRSLKRMIDDFKIPSSEYQEILEKAYDFIDQKVKDGMHNINGNYKSIEFRKYILIKMRMFIRENTLGYNLKSHNNLQRVRNLEVIL